MGKSVGEDKKFSLNIRGETSFYCLKIKHTFKKSTYSELS